jgi:hypothetical protein
MEKIKCKKCNWYEHDARYATCFNCSGLEEKTRKIDMSKIPGCTKHPEGNIALAGFGGWACDCEGIKRRYLKSKTYYAR